MKAYRIGSGMHPIFDGSGASLYPGRWNAANQRVIYCGATFAIAMLERLCYSRIGKPPDGDRFVELDVPDDAVETFEAERHPGWDSPGSEVARTFGSRWHREARSLGLLVPSVVTRVDWNLVLNPDHPDIARVAVGPEQTIVWDRRLFAR